MKFHAVKIVLCFWGMSFVAAPETLAPDRAALAPASQIEKEHDFDRLKPDIGVVVGEGHQAILNAVTGPDGKLIPDIGVLRFKDEAQHRDTIRTYEFARQFFAAKPQLKDNVMQVLRADERRLYVFVRLEDTAIEDSGAIRPKVIRKPLSLKQFLQQSPTENEKLEVLRQILFLFLELRRGNPEDRAYDFTDMDPQNFLVVREAGRMRIVRVDFADFEEISRESPNPFRRLLILIGEIFFPEVPVIGAEFRSAPDLSAAQADFKERMGRSYLTQNESWALSFMYEFFKAGPGQAEMVLERVWFELGSRLAPVPHTGSVETAI